MATPQDNIIARDYAFAMCEARKARQSGDEEYAERCSRTATGYVSRSHLYTPRAREALLAVTNALLARPKDTSWQSILIEAEVEYE